MQLDTDPLAYGLGVGQVIHGGAVFGAVVFLPVLHEQAFDLIALFQQEQSRDGGVDAAGHADDDSGIGWYGHGKSTLGSKAPILTEGGRRVASRVRSADQTERMTMPAEVVIDAAQYQFATPTLRFAK